MKRNVILFISMSLDGYIADKEGSIEWLSVPMEAEDTTYDAFYKNVDTVLLGYKTYHQIVTELAVDNFPYKDVQTLVFTRRDLTSDETNIQFINDDVVSQVQALKHEPGNDIWIVGGASLVRHLVDANLIDEYQIAIIPKLIGDGISLFSKSLHQQGLKVVSSNVINDIVYLTYHKVD
ncbi:dihydrofolate reductase family protein [Erysipelothrix anatis]|uniref:dihydrofolate reductase family protein n=1 Tax=Erysipelothrix anatis TaxID=2683713 RepID=UPI001358E7FD|nr:dihydrofolate reductase family protein [Erysipelothrix anatis]